MAGSISDPAGGPRLRGQIQEAPLLGSASRHRQTPEAGEPCPGSKRSRALGMESWDKPEFVGVALHLCDLTRALINDVGEVGAATDFGLDIFDDVTFLAEADV